MWRMLAYYLVIGSALLHLVVMVLRHVGAASRVEDVLAVGFALCAPLVMWIAWRQGPQPAEAVSEKPSAKGMDWPDLALVIASVVLAILGITAAITG